MRCIATACFPYLLPGRKLGLWSRTPERLWRTSDFCYIQVLCVNPFTHYSLLTISSQRVNILLVGPKQNFKESAKQEHATVTDTLKWHFYCQLLRNKYQLYSMPNVNCFMLFNTYLKHLVKSTFHIILVISFEMMWSICIKRFLKSHLCLRESHRHIYLKQILKSKLLQPTWLLY